MEFSSSVVCDFAIIFLILERLFYDWKNYFAFDAEIIFFIEFRALDATRMGDRTACFLSLIFFSSDFSRSICVLLSVRLPRFMNVFAAAAAVAAAIALELVCLLHGDGDCAHFVDARARFRQIMRGVIVVSVVAVAVVLLVQTVDSTALPLRTSISVNV